MLSSSFMRLTSSLTAWMKSSWPAMSEVTTANCLQLYLRGRVENIAPRHGWWLLGHIATYTHNHREGLERKGLSMYKLNI